MGFLRVTVFLISLSYQGKTDVSFTFPAVNILMIYQSPLRMFTAGKVNETSGKETIRCYCNLDQCLSNNLCSYEDGGCFSDFLDYRDVTKAKHGCLHLLKRERQEQCGNAVGSSSRSPRSLLLCCKADMCNQVLGPTSIITNSIIGSLINATEGRQNGLSGGSFIGNENYDNSRSNTNEVWFKAATIAVPICGAMILLLLVALAFKILRADHVSVEKYCGKGKSNANYSDSHIVSFKTSELNSKDLSKKIPLLYETRQSELQNCENFRNYTSTRIHFGQNVNILRDNQDSSKVEKNLENAKINLEKPRVRQMDVPTTSNSQFREDNNNSISVEDNSNSILDVREDEEENRILPTLSLNLDKPENLNICNIYSSPRTDGQSSLSINVSDKVYEKYLL